MNKINLTSDLTFSRIVAGVWKWGAWGWKLNTQQKLQLIEKSIEYGATTFDHADIYGHYTAEEEFGKALALNPSLRDTMQLVSKCGIKLVTPNRPSHKITSYNTSKEHILQSTENSLKALRTDYLDLLLIHRPDPLMNPEEVAEAFTQLKQDGKVRYFGVSNFTPSQFNLLNAYFPLVTNQVEASLVHLNPFLDGTFDQCLQHRLKPMVWSPLGSGKIFTDKEDPAIHRIRQAAEPLMYKYDCQLDQLLLAWLLKHPAQILPVLGTARPERIKAAVEALQIKLSREEWFELWQASTGVPVP